MTQVSAENSYYGQLNRLEPLVPLTLGLHGTAMLLFFGGTLWQWLIVGSVGLLGVAGLLGWSGSPWTALWRAGYMLAVTWLLMLATGGTGSFFLLWFFVLLPVYGLILPGSYRATLPGLVALAYFLFLLLPVQPLPPVVVLARTLLLAFLGWFTYALGTITRRYAAEQTQAKTRLEQSEQRLTTAFDNMPDPFMIYDRDRRIQYLNRQGLALIGLSAAEVFGRTDEELLPPALTAKVVPLLERAVASRTLQRAECVLPLDPEPLTVIITFVPILDESGEIFEILGITHDISARKKAEVALKRSAQRLGVLHEIDQSILAALRTSEARYRAIVEDQTELISRHRPDGTLTFVNEAYCRYFGRTRQALLDQTFIELVVDEDRQALLEKFVCLTPANPVEIDEHREHDASGHLRWLRWADRGLFDDDGTLIEIQSVGWDITEQKQTEERLQRYAERLQTLHDIDQAILAAQSSATIAEVALDHLRQIIPCRRASVILFDFEAQELFRLAVVDQTPTGPTSGSRDPLTPEYQQLIVALRQNQILHQPDLSVLPPHPLANEVSHSEAQSLVIIPLLVQGALIGSLNLWANQTETLAEEHLEVAREVASQLAIAIQNARLYEAEQEARHLAEALQAANLELTRSLELNVVLDRVLSYMRLVVAYDTATIMLLESDTRLVVRAVRGFEQYGPDSEKLVGITFNPQANPIIRQVLTEQRPLIVADTQGEPAWERTPGTAHIRSWLGVPLIVGEQAIGQFSLDKTELNYFKPAHTRAAEALAAVAAVAVQNARLYGQSQEWLQKLTAVYRAAQQLQQFYATEALSEQLIRVLEETLGYEHGAVLLLEPETERLLPFAISDQGQGVDFVAQDKAFIASHSISLGKGITGWVAQTGQSVCLGDVRHDERYYDLRGDIRSELCVPLWMGDDIIGVVNIESPQPDYYTETDQWVLETVAAQIAVAIQNARLVEQLQTQAEALEQRVIERTAELETQYRRQAAMDERQRLARDLHDVVSQTLFSASVIAETLPRLWERNPQQVRHGLDELHRLNRGALAEMRTLLLELRPAALEETNLSNLLQQLIDGFAGRTQAGISLMVEVAMPLQAAVKLTVYRVTQEALNNIVKHGRAKKVEIRVWPVGDEGLMLSIRDDGRGLDLDRIPTGRLGLGIMRERAAAVGASLTIDSSPGQGTEIKMAWLNQAESA